MSEAKTIKFRQCIDGQFHYWGFIDGIFISPVTSSSGENPSISQHDQCTGLKDKNGKEIYGGDILRLHYSHHEVIDGIVRWFSANRHPSDGIYGMETAKWVLDKYLRETGKECLQYVYHMSVEGIREVIGNVRIEGSVKEMKGERG